MSGFVLMSGHHISNFIQNISFISCNSLDQLFGCQLLKWFPLMSSTMEIDWLLYSQILPIAPD